MQLVAAPSPYGTTTYTPGTALPADGDYVATVNYRAGNWRVITTDRVVGDATGYASVDDAIAALSVATKGQGTPAAGVFEGPDGRFVGRSLQAGWYDFQHPQNADAPSSFTYLEWLKDLPFQPPLFPAVHIGRDPSGKTFPTDPTLRAIVDGAALVRPPVAG